MAYPVGSATLQHTTTASTTVTVTLPTHAAGDLIVIFLSQNDGTTAISESSAFSWTVRNPASVTGAARMAVAYKYSSGGGESNPTFTGSTTQAWSVQTLVIRDADPTTYVAGYASNTFTSNPAASPALTTVDADDAYGPILLLYGWCFDGTETLGRTYTSDLVALGLEAGDHVAEVTDRTISSIVGYRNQSVFGAVPSINAYGTVAGEGGNAWVLAIKNKSGGVVAPDVRSGMTELNWYGNFGAVHQTVTWQAPSNFAATINGITVDTVAASTATSSGNNQTPWGTLTYLERNNSVASQWTGGSHTTSSTELYNGTPTFPYTWTDGTAAAANRAIRLRVSYVSGATAKEFIEANIGTCGQTSGTAAVSYLVNQVADTTYNSNAIDGPAIYATSGITFTDAATDRVNCNIGGGSVTYKTIYACFVYWNFTATGIANDFTYISAPDTANYILSGMKIRNTSATDLSVTGGYGRDATSGASVDIIDTAGSTGNIFLAPDHVVAYATGSGVTAQDITDIAAASAASTAPSVWTESKALTVGKFLGLK